MPDLTVLAIDLGGSHAASGVVRGCAVLASTGLAADGRLGMAGLLPAMKKAFDDLLPKAGVAPAECVAVVLGFCGIVSAREKRVLSTSEKFDDATTIGLCGSFEGAFRLPFLIENDARLALLGEHRFGAARGSSDAVMVTLGSGIGGAALLNGRLLESKHGLCGTIGGHLPVVLDGRLCGCGNRGCAESEASTAVLPQIYKEQSGGAAGALAGKQAFGFAALFDAADSGDAPAFAALEHCLRVWSVLTVALVHAYDPEVVVFGGSVMKRAAQILPRIQQYVDTYAWTPNRTVPLRLAILGQNAPLLGAIPLAESSL